MVEVLIVGAGPAGAAAALVLARAGVRLLVVDRARFPRDKLCGDSVNPGTLAWLDVLGVREQVERDAVRLEGMVVTSSAGQVIGADYRRGLRGAALPRRVLDQALLESATAAGARVEQEARVTGPIVDGGTVRGVHLRARGRSHRIPALVTIAADGRRSSLAFGLGLARHPVRPRRWAIGQYMTDVAGLGPRGEMHVRSGHYVGIAPLPGGVANVCLVTVQRAGFDAPADLLRRIVEADPVLAHRFTRARAAGPATCVGPLAVDASGAGRPGLLLAGDAAGFIDPMTGDGLRFALEGGVLAAEAALDALEHGADDAHVTLAARRHRAFAAKQRFNRLLRGLVATRGGVEAAQVVARLAPYIVRRLVLHASDVALAARSLRVAT